MYEPLLLTHHEASWTKFKDYHGPVNYPGVIVKQEDIKNIADTALANEISRDKNYYTKETIKKHFAKPIAIAKKYNVPLNCGEWGCLTTVPDAARFQWYRDVKSVLEENNISWTTWEYKSDFGIINKNGQEEKELINILVKQ
jgi:endoglucanase